MTAQKTNDKPLKAVVTIAQHCRQLQMSRSQFYWHVKKGTFHEPLRMESNNRPYFTASMVEDNMQARETGIGVNGEYVLFYERQSNAGTSGQPKRKPNHSGLIEGLKALGLTAVTSEQVESALTACFPKGTSGEEETAILRAVFRHLKRSGVS